MTASCPWMSKADEARFNRMLRQKSRELDNRDPALARRLKRMSLLELEELELSLLRLMPHSSEVAYDIRTIEELRRWRAVPRPPRPRYRPKTAVGNAEPPALTQPPSRLSDAPTVPTESSTAAVSATRPPPDAAPTKPDNVIRPYFGPKAFGVGTRPYWTEQ